MAPRCDAACCVMWAQKLGITTEQQRRQADRRARDDDDLYHPDRLAQQVGPILRGEADMTVMAWSHHMRYPEMAFYRRQPGGLPFLGSLAYRRSISKGIRGFANASLAEDLHFVDRALDLCARLAVLTIDMVYVRHSHNTWGAFENLLKMWRPAEQAPDFVSPTLLAQLRAAHEATGRRAACPVVEQHAVEGMDKTKAVAKLRRAIASPFGSSCIK